MKPRSRTGFIVTLAGVLGAIVAGAVWQWRETEGLRVELATLRPDAGELDRLRRENERLRARQIPAAELEALRADHAALPRLRAELEALRQRR
jgi:hypothetical protein